MSFDLVEVIGIALISFANGIVWTSYIEERIERNEERLQKKVDRIEALNEIKEVTKEIDSRRKQ